MVTKCTKTLCLPHRVDGGGGGVQQAGGKEIPQPNSCSKIFFFKGAKQILRSSANNICKQRHVEE